MREPRTEARPVGHPGKRRPLVPPCQALLVQAPLAEVDACPVTALLGAARHKRGLRERVDGAFAGGLPPQGSLQGEVF